MVLLRENCMRSKTDEYGCFDVDEDDVEQAFDNAATIGSYMGEDDDDGIYSVCGRHCYTSAEEALA